MPRSFRGIEIVLPGIEHGGHGGVWLDWRLHGSLDQRRIYRVCYELFVVTSLKLLWDGASRYLAC